MPEKNIFYKCNSLYVEYSIKNECIMCNNEKKYFKFTQITNQTRSFNIIEFNTPTQVFEYQISTIKQYQQYRFNVWILQQVGTCYIGCCSLITEVVY